MGIDEEHFSGTVFHHQVHDEEGEEDEVVPTIHTCTHTHTTHTHTHTHTHNTHTLYKEKKTR